MSQDAARIVDKTYSYEGLTGVTELPVTLVNAKSFSFQCVGASQDSVVSLQVRNTADSAFVEINSVEVGPTGADGEQTFVEGINYYYQMKLVITPVSGADLTIGALVLGAAE